MEYNDVYDAHRQRTGRLHLRGTPWAPGEYHLTVCVWVYDGKGRVLLTRRAPGKSFAGTWENSGGAAQAGEESLQAIIRELREETGIQAEPWEFQLLSSEWDRTAFYDHYCLKRDIPLSQIRLQPGETDDVRWATFEEVRTLIDQGRICAIIAKQYLNLEQELVARSK